MFKRLTLIGVLGVFLLTAVVTLAADKEATASPKESTATSSAISGDKVRELKDKLATKVAELRASQKRGISGEIASLSKATFTLITSKGEIRVRLSEDTQVFDMTKKKTEKAVTDLKNSQSVSVLGYYDDKEELEQARVILIQSLPKQLSGELSKIDKTKGILTLKLERDKETAVDYEKTTTADEYSPAEKKVKKSGLSRLSIGDRTIIWVLAAPDDPQKLSIIRLFRLPQEMFTANVKGETNVATPSASIASPSATLKSAAKASPNATPKTSPKASPQASPEN